MRVLLHGRPELKQQTTGRVAVVAGEEAAGAVVPRNPQRHYSPRLCGNRSLLRQGRKPSL
jgi:hypothetical protein